MILGVRVQGSLCQLEGRLKPRVGGWAPAPIGAQLPSRSPPGQSPYRDPDLEKIRWRRTETCSAVADIRDEPGTWMRERRVAWPPGGFQPLKASAGPQRGLSDLEGADPGLSFPPPSRGSDSSFQGAHPPPSACEAKSSLSPHVSLNLIPFSQQEGNLTGSNTDMYVRGSCWLQVSFSPCDQDPSPLSSSRLVLPVSWPQS